MKVNELTDVIQGLYHADRAGMIWGAPGIGKSYSFREAAKVLRDQMGLKGPVLERHEAREYAARGGDMKQAFGMFDLRLSQSDPVDVGGLPRENKNTGATERLPPSWFAHTGRSDLPEYGILLLDELPSAPLSVQTAAYQITLDKVIDEYRLKEGWAVFAAGNRVTDGGQYFKMPMALANRFCHIDVESDVDSWCEWAIDVGVDISLVAFIRFRPDLLNTYEHHVKDKVKGFAFATERQWAAVNEVVTNNVGLDPLVMSRVAEGLVGEGPALEYMAFRDVWASMPNVDAILINPTGAPVPDDASTQFAVCTAVAARCTAGNIAACLTYAERFATMGRPEMMMLLVKDIVRRQDNEQAKAAAIGSPHQNPINSAAFTQFVTKYASLFG